MQGSSVQGDDIMFTSWAARLRRAIHVWKIKIKKPFLSDLRLKSFHNHNAPAVIIMYPRARPCAVIGSQSGHANLSRVSALALIGATVGQQNQSPGKDETLQPCSEFAKENAKCKQTALSEISMKWEAKTSNITECLCKRITYASRAWSVCLYNTDECFVQWRE